MAVVLRDQDSQKVVLEIQDALDRNTVPEIRKQILKIIKKRDIRQVDILAHGVTSMDTAGVALLLETWRTLEKKSGALKLRGLNEGALRIIQLARLNDVLSGSIVEERNEGH